MQWITWAGVWLVAVTPSLAQVTVRVVPAAGQADQYGTITATVEVDLGTTGKMLGSYGATLAWNTSVLSYLSDSGGGEPAFDAAVVNRDDTSTGSIAFSDASAAGSGNEVRVFDVTFLVVGSPVSSTVLDLELTSIYAAGTFEDLSTGLNVQDGLVTVTDFFLDLHPTDMTGTLYAWNVIPGAVTYDLIRGDVGSILDNGTTIRLGTVTCIEDDSADTTTGAGTEASNPDTAMPSAGNAYFYLVRFNDGSNRTYGYGHPVVHQRIPDTGDCP